MRDGFSSHDETFRFSSSLCGYLSQSFQYVSNAIHESLLCTSVPGHVVTYANGSLVLADLGAQSSSSSWRHWLKGIQEASMTYHAMSA